MISILKLIEKPFIIDKNGKIIQVGDKVSSVLNPSFKGICVEIEKSYAQNKGPNGMCDPLTLKRYKEIIYREDWS